MNKVLNPYSHNFALHPEEVSDAKDIQFKVETTPGDPVQQWPRRLTPANLEAVQEQIRKLLAMGRIARAEGEWSSPIVVVRRPGEMKIWLCVDFREVNKWSIGEKYPLP